MIVIGLGTGRCGTTSLAGLIDRQPLSACFHEMNVSSISHQGSFRPIENSMEEFAGILGGGPTDRLTIDRTEQAASMSYEVLQKKGHLKVIGDIAHYYLYYINQIADMSEDIRFVCLKRDKEEVVRSWITKTTLRRTGSQLFRGRLKAMIMGRDYYVAENLLQDHDGIKWRFNAKWDKCFPKFNSCTVEDSIRQYWDHYYQKAEAYQSALPTKFRIFDMQDLNTDDGRASILQFCGYEEDSMVNESVHLNESTATTPG